MINLDGKFKMVTSVVNDGTHPLDFADLVTTEPEARTRTNRLSGATMASASGWKRRLGEIERVRTGRDACVAPSLETARLALAFGRIVTLIPNALVPTPHSAGLMKRPGDGGCGAAVKAESWKMQAALSVQAAIAPFRLPGPLTRRARPPVFPPYEGGGEPRADGTDHPNLTSRLGEGAQRCSPGRTVA
ncbi:hypothetical protein [Labrys miyagiensis]|uniref:hypothetical protein n=1 Tax=Labrys miyagiensis TaxID=346912 RepID=UPI0024E098BC|nr:hypothetical protein [Labrys miyagiensis]